MEGRKVVIVEANEVPLRIVEGLVDGGRLPFFRGLLDAGTLVETEVSETLDQELYPSQTWASMNTGATFEEHGIHWYGDPKPADVPLFWQRAARSGRSVGLVNTLHSSPVDQQCTDGDYRFVIPDCFSSDAGTIPSRYHRFQRANTALTSANSRQAGLRPGRAQLLDLAASLPHLGLRPESAVRLAALVARVATGRVPRERLRCGQFIVQQDLFLHLLEREQPDLAVLFTNHVASAMHRYWYAHHPDDFATDHYGPDWVERYRDEITNAMVLLDQLLVRLQRWCVDHDRTLIVASSMGQGPSPSLCTDAGHEAVVVDPHRFLDGIGIDEVDSVLGSMVPQLTLACGTATRAAATAAKLADADVGEVFWDVDRSDAVVTLTYRIDVLDETSVRVGGVRRSAAAIGVDVQAIDDHSSGRHIPRGILGVANSPHFKAPVDGIADYLEYAPAVLHHLGLPPADRHRMPQFQI